VPNLNKAYLICPLIQKFEISNLSDMNLNFQYLPFFRMIRGTNSNNLSIHPTKIRNPFSFFEFQFFKMILSPEI
jgi:hypothetical protein